jgi:hypothetical protein
MKKMPIQKNSLICERDTQPEHTPEKRERREKNTSHLWFGALKIHEKEAHEDVALGKQTEDGSERKNKKFDSHGLVRWNATETILARSLLLFVCLSRSGRRNWEWMNCNNNDTHRKREESFQRRRWWQRAQKSNDATEVDRTLHGARTYGR